MVSIRFSIILPLLLLFWKTYAAPRSRACPLLGQQYPPPVHLCDNHVFQAATRQVEDALQASAQVYGLSNTSLSIGIFTTSEEGPLYEYHHTNALLSNSTYGARKINADSIYRIGSISKMLTVYLLLIEDGDRHFNDPIATHVPELLVPGSSWNSITPQWTEITIGDLAGQMSGLARDFGLSDFAPLQGQISNLPPSLQEAFPEIPSSEIPKCGYPRSDGTLLACSLQDYIVGIASESPIFPTAYTPVYSNEAFALLGLALEHISNKQPESVFNTDLVEALGLTGTYYTVPESIPSTAAIPSNPVLAWWDTDLGVFAPAGGYFSSTNDLATIGKAILNSTLLPTAQTRRWMKPTGFVESFDQGVGRPWEIFRQKVNRQSVDIYTKAGDWGVYSSVLALVPQFDFGFTLLTATNPGTTAGSTVRNDFPNVIMNTLLPVLDQIAKDQAASNFAGVYIEPTTNSSLTITTDTVNSGLIVSSWTSNGVSFLPVVELTTPNLVFRLQPNQIEYGDHKIGFTSYYSSVEPPTDNDIVYIKCAGWFDVDEFTYGNIPLGQMVFDIDPDGKATSVELRAFRQTLKKRA